MMSEPLVDDERTRPQFEFVSGALCLDFTNTVGNLRRGHSECLVDYRDLLAWTCQTGLLQTPDADCLQQTALRDPGAADRALTKALHLRAALHRLLGGPHSAPDRADLRLLNRSVREMAANRSLEVTGNSLGWRFRCTRVSLEFPLWPVVDSALELLTSPHLTRVSECRSEDCTWLFLDRSRGHRRRWCDMKTCGNRNKVRRHYERHKMGSSG